MKIGFNNSFESFICEEMSTRVKPKRTSNRTPSVVWNFFYKTDDNQHVICTICKREYKFFGNTTNMMTHLKYTHPFILETGDNEATSAVEFIQENGENGEPAYRIEVKQADSKSKLKRPKIKKNDSDDEYDPGNKRRRPNPYKLNRSFQGFTTIQQPRSEDSLDFFSKYITSLMRDLPKSIQAVLQLKLLQIITEEKLKAAEREEIASHHQNEILIETVQGISQDDECVEEVLHDEHNPIDNEHE